MQPQAPEHIVLFAESEPAQGPCMGVDVCSSKPQYKLSVRQPVIRHMSLLAEQVQAQAGGRFKASVDGCA